MYSALAKSAAKSRNGLLSRESPLNGSGRLKWREGAHVANEALLEKARQIAENPRVGVEAGSAFSLGWIDNLKKKQWNSIFFAA